MEKVIYLAGGCFWGVEGYFKRLKGVIDTTVGYANGNIKNPTYTQVKTHIATHAETVKITYDDTIISLTKLLEHFLRIINPYELNHQGEDFGIQYRTGIYYLSHYDEKIISFLFVDGYNAVLLRLSCLVQNRLVTTNILKYLQKV